MTDYNHGFDLLSEHNICEIGASARLYRHRKSGAEFLSLSSEDENKVFGIAFATPSEDSTGVAHIMEHSVLCGSRKYPLKEPFVELIKGSLNTFLNAMTWPDHTIYPVASQSVTDLYNLADVYLDAVFYPNLSRWTFMQEGWHYELEQNNGPLHYKGVVFNEMKGNYSSPDSMLGEYLRQALFPDTLYGRDSGGDPAAIPDLDYARFKAFHQAYYHPSNARIFFYGDDDPDRRLCYLDSWLNAFEAVAIKPRLPLQPRWNTPRRVSYEYDPGDAPDRDDAYVSVAWLLGEHRDPELLLGLELLAHLLAGTPASPLRKALIDSGLGDDVTGGAVDSDSREAYFPIGLSGVDPEQVDQVEKLIINTVDDLADSGFDEDQIEASLNTIEFHLREANFGDFPRGLVYMIQALQTWLYEGNPCDPLAFEKPLNAIKGRLRRGEALFTDWLRQYFVANPHRTTVMMLPNSNWLAERDRKEQARLERARAEMSEADLRRLVEETKTLQRRQVTPDSVDALATIPALTVADLTRENRQIPIDVGPCREARVVFHDLPTHGIVYLDVGFDLQALSATDLPYGGLLGALLLDMGTVREDFVSLARRIGRATGGIQTSAINTVIHGQRSAVSCFVVRGKCTVENFDALLDILRDVLLSLRLDDRERLKQILLEEKAGLESELVPGGRRFVNLRLRSAFTAADWASEQIDGISYLFFLRRLIERVTSDWPGLLDDLQRVRETLVSRNGLVVNVTVDGGLKDRLQTRLEAFIDDLPMCDRRKTADWPIGSAVDEGLSVPSQVNFVGKGADLYTLGHRMHGSWLAVHNWLNTTYLWERIRVQGGAYGGSCAFDPLSGAFSFLSYRDPNLSATLSAYDGAADFIRSHRPDALEVERTIVGVIGALDAYMLPDAKGYTSLNRYLTAMTEERRQQIRDEVLATTASDFARFEEVLDDVARCGRVVVLGAPQAIEQANAERGARWLKPVRVL
ncbi:MAG: insulinase family protein [Methylotetracoccus sp.]|jgi:hypothetical protein|nr:insulinase family protein [Methylotetracoccus sp.]